jgi:predicted nucleic acid-binding Zn finger protein
MIKEKKKEEITKTMEIINNKGVKLHIFYPSGLEFWTVVGKDGEYVQFEQGALCSCPAFFFNILRNSDGTCHHVNALKLSKEKLTYKKIVGNDSEVTIFIKLLSFDV